MPEVDETPLATLKTWPPCSLDERLVVMFDDIPPESFEKIFRTVTVPLGSG